jgi:putative addiction module killer protein
MAEDSITVLEYQTEDGRQPFSEWLEKLRDLAAAQRIDARLSRMRLGNIGDARSVSKGVSELRIAYGPGYRIYFGRKGSRFVILLCGGDKRTQQKDILRAQEYWADFLRRTS